MKIYDCLLFFNELDLLELRLKTLNDDVDLFVLVESAQTFSGKPKPLYYEKNLARFEPWAHKIRHVVVPHIGTTNPWEREWGARNYMVHGLWDAQPEDLVFQSDCDEIWRPERKYEQLDAAIAIYQQVHSYYSLNTIRVPRVAWHGTRRVKRKNWVSGQAIRQYGARQISAAYHGDVLEPIEQAAIIEDGGWHFSFLGDAEHARTKMKAFSHTEYSDEMFTNIERLQKLVQAGFDPIHPTARYVPINCSALLPQPVLAEPERWAKFIRPVPTEAI